MLMDDEKPKQGVDYNVAMRRLVYMAAIGAAVILIYALRTTKFLDIAGVGLMAGGAALLTGGLMGFLFGVPHTKEDAAATRSTEKPTERSEEQFDAGAHGSETRYLHNTSLEQISDWLTKILVGVGLVEIKAISEHLWLMATALRKGLGDAEGADAFALALLLYFFACGFIFGFLWARLYLVLWFREVDTQTLVGKINELEQRQLADARALALIDQQLRRNPDDPEATEKKLRLAILPTSQAAKTQIFSLAKEASENFKADHHDLRVETAISVFKGLVASDERERDHRARAELSYALSRRKPPDLKAAEEQLSKAIEVRDKLRLKGWKYYEMRRARYRIEQDANLNKTTRSENAAVEAILTDLRAAREEADRWPGWLENDPSVKPWLALNDIEPSRLERRVPPQP